MVSLTPITLVAILSFLQVRAAPQATPVAFLPAFGQQFALQIQAKGPTYNQKYVAVNSQAENYGQVGPQLTINGQLGKAGTFFLVDSKRPGVFEIRATDIKFGDGSDVTQASNLVVDGNNESNLHHLGEVGLDMFDNWPTTTSYYTFDQSTGYIKLAKLNMGGPQGRWVGCTDHPVDNSSAVNVPTIFWYDGNGKPAVDGCQDINLKIVPYPGK